MPKCTDNERKLIDSYVSSGQFVSTEIYKSVLGEKVTQNLRNRLKHAIVSVKEAQKHLDDVKSELFSISPDMDFVFNTIESEVNDSK